MVINWRGLRNISAIDGVDGQQVSVYCRVGLAASVPDGNRGKTRELDDCWQGL